LLTVTQNAQATSSSQQTRSFAFDWLGRTTSETNPESGTTTYIYDSITGSYCGGTVSAPGKLLQTNYANGNIVCFAYDALGRLTNQDGYPSSNGNAGICRRLRYDEVSNGVQTQPSGSTLSNLAGRLVEAETDTCGVSPTLITDEWFSYSPRGELTAVYESTPHSGGYYHTMASYWPTGALETLSGIPGVPTINYGASGAGLDGEGRYTQVTAASGTNPVTSVTYSTSSTTNPLGALTGVTFGSADSDTFTYDPNTGRVNTYTFSVNGQTDVGTLTWNTNGTLGMLAIVDGITGSNDTQTCNYSYDDLQRLSSTGCGTLWGQNFTYDAFGNISKTVPSGDSGITFLRQFGPQKSSPQMER
jgi:YD repeat-containing protein